MIQVSRAKLKNLCDGTTAIDELSLWLAARLRHRGIHVHPIKHKRLLVANHETFLT